MIALIATFVVLGIAVAVIRATARQRVDELTEDLAAAWADVEDARAERRDVVADLVDLLAPLADDEHAPTRRIVDTLRREHLAAARSVTAVSAPRIEQRLMAAVGHALDLAADRPDLAAEADDIRARLDRAGDELAEWTESWNVLARSLTETASSFPGVLLGGVHDEPEISLGGELARTTGVRRR